jgi:transducin (beta)-like 1
VLASGSHDHCVNLWSVKEGTLIKSYPSTGGVFEVKWNDKGDRLGICRADSVAVVLSLPQKIEGGLLGGL